MEIQVPRPILDYYCKVCSVQHLSNNKAKELIMYDNTKYVITGFGSSAAEGYLWCSAKKVAPVEIYDGDLKPLYYQECYLEVLEGNRERGYNAQLFEYQGNKYVTMPGDSITFKPTEEGVQLDLF